VQNQFGEALTLGASTPFEIASLSKTFTAALYALLIRAFDPTLRVGDYSQPNGPLPISSALADITLDQLVNYTSGLPHDNDDATIDAPPYWSYPYSMPAMMSFLQAFPPRPSSPGVNYSYSNLAFALMSAIIASEGSNPNPRAGAFVKKIREYIFDPLGLEAKFFTEVSLADFPLGYNCSYVTSNIPTYTATSPGSPFFPAYFGAGGIVATPKDMFRWLLFNMGAIRNNLLTPLLAALQMPSTTVTSGASQFGLGWFINPSGPSGSATIWKDGDLGGFGSYMAFLPSDDPGYEASPAGAFVLVNGTGVADVRGVEAACALANDVLLIMQGQTPPADKSVYPSSLRIPARANPGFAGSPTLVPSRP
jgi:serine-type D-Ala-D-Ala carboxypeptidase/endopeptidase